MAPSLLPRCFRWAGDGGAAECLLGLSLARTFRELPEHFPNWTRNQTMPGPRLPRPQASKGGSISGLAREPVTICERPECGLGFRQQEGGRPPSPLSRQKEEENPPARERRVAGEAGRGRGRRSRSRRRKQPPPQLKLCGRGLPAGGRRERVLSSFSTPHAHVGPAPPGLAPAARATASSPADAGGGKTSASAFKGRGHVSRPHTPSRQ